MFFAMTMHIYTSPNQESIGSRYREQCKEIVMTEAERIDFLIRELANNNAATFGAKIGLSRATIAKMRKGSIGIRLNVDAILEAYPQVRKEWLTTGEGYPGDLSVDLVRAHYEAKVRRLEGIVDMLITERNRLQALLESEE